MIELMCKRCKQTFERRGANKGKQPLCTQCRENSKRSRIDSLVFLNPNPNRGKA